MCDHKYVCTSWKKTCTECGVETYFLTLDTYSMFSAPLERGYSRAQRFRIKVDKLLKLHSGPHCCDPIWTYLESRKLFLNGPFDVRQCIRSSKLKLKHYDCVRIFTNAFTSYKVKLHKTPHLLKEILVGKFEELYYSWLKTNSQSFFSYDWVLRYFLSELNSPLVVYLKPKTCGKRDKKYRERLNDFQKIVKLRVVASKQPVFRVGYTV